MNAVYCFSGCGHGRAVAEYFAERLDMPLLDMENHGENNDVPYRTVVAVFPVYSDNIPVPAEDFLRNIRCEGIALIAVYGGVSHGNVLSRAAELSDGEVICGAYVPAGHTYLNQPPDFDRRALEPIIARIMEPIRTVLPSKRQSILGRLFPETRARMLVRIVRSGECDRCGLCVSRCPVSAMAYDGIRKNCLRCLRCVNICPKGALKAKYAPFLKTYLIRNRHQKTEIFL